MVYTRELGSRRRMGQKQNNKSRPSIFEVISLWSNRVQNGKWTAHTVPSLSSQSEYAEKNKNKTTTNKKKQYPLAWYILIVLLYLD